MRCSPRGVRSYGEGISFFIGTKLNTPSSQANILLSGESIQLPNPTLPFSNSSPTPHQLLTNSKQTKTHSYLTHTHTHPNFITPMARSRRDRLQSQSPLPPLRQNSTYTDPRYTNPHEHTFWPTFTSKRQVGYTTYCACCGRNMRGKMAHECLNNIAECVAIWCEGCKEKCAVGGGVCWGYNKEGKKRGGCRL